MVEANREMKMENEREKDKENDSKMKMPDLKIFSFVHQSKKMFYSVMVMIV